MPHLMKRTIAEALKTKMNAKPLDKITVKELAEDCQINRQTFYYHFQDVYDLLGWIYKTEAIGSIQNARSYETWQQGLLIILEYVAENKLLCINTYRSLGREHLEDFLNKSLYELLGGVTDEIIGVRHINEDDRVFIVKFYCYAFAGVLLDWIKSGIKTESVEIVRSVSLIMKDNISAAVERFSV